MREKRKAKIFNFAEQFQQALDVKLCEESGYQRQSVLFMFVLVFMSNLRMLQSRVRTRKQLKREWAAEIEAATAAAWTPMETVLRPMARLLTGPRPEGAELWHSHRGGLRGPRHTCAAVIEEEEETDDCTADTEKGRRRSAGSSHRHAGMLWRRKEEDKRCG